MIAWGTIRITVVLATVSMLAGCASSGSLIGSRAVIVDRGYALSTIQGGDGMAWPNAEIKRVAGLEGWKKWDFRNGDKARIEYLSMRETALDRVYILRIGTHYVPILSEGIRIVGPKGTLQKAPNTPVLPSELQRQPLLVVARRRDIQPGFVPPRAEVFRSGDLPTISVFGIGDLSAKFRLLHATTGTPVRDEMADGWWILNADVVQRGYHINRPDLLRLPAGQYRIAIVKKGTSEVLASDTFAVAH